MHIRSFIAIELPENIKDRLREVQEELKEHCREKSGNQGKTSGRISWVRPEAMHLTLKFLGDIDAAKVDAIKAALHAAVGTENKNGTLIIKEFDLHLTRAGAFPDAKRPRVVWVGLDGINELNKSNTLNTLVNKIEERLKDIGFTGDRKKFTPHLTVCRARDGRGQKNLSTAMAAINTTGPEASSINKNFTVTEFILFKSELKPGGTLHTPLETIKLRSNI